MAVRARSRCWFVIKHVSAVYLPLQRMAFRACNILVASAERERCLAVVEERRSPFVAIVASRAIIHAGSKLLSMRVFVAFCALCRSPGEVDMNQVQLHVWRLVAVCASDCAMRSEQRERCLRMVKFRQVLPTLGRMASLASRDVTGSIARADAGRELPLVHILMTS